MAGKRYIPKGDNDTWKKVVLTVSVQFCSVPIPWFRVISTEPRTSEKCVKSRESGPRSMGVIEGRLMNNLNLSATRSAASHQLIAYSHLLLWFRDVSSHYRCWLECPKDSLSILNHLDELRIT